MSRSLRDRSGVSLLEVVLVLGSLIVILVPVVNLYTASRRIGFSARRHVEVTLYAQTVLEALAALPRREFPPQSPSSSGQVFETCLFLDDAQAPPTGGASYQKVLDHLGKTPPVPMKRKIKLTQPANTTDWILTFEVSWTDAQGERDPARASSWAWQKLTLSMLASSRP